MSVFMFSLQSIFTVLSNQKSLRDYFPISLISFSYSYLILPEAFGSFIFFFSVACICKCRVYYNPQAHSAETQQEKHTHWDSKGQSEVPPQ